MEEKSKQETCTVYEVYDKRTGKAVINRETGELLRVEHESTANTLVTREYSSADRLLRLSWNIPDGAELDFREVEVPS